MLIPAQGEHACILLGFITAHTSPSLVQCLAAGSYIAHREAESDELRPFAAHVTECIHRIRLTLRSQGPSLGAPETFPESVSPVVIQFHSLTLLISRAHFHFNPHPSHHLQFVGYTFTDSSHSGDVCTVPSVLSGLLGPTCACTFFHCGGHTCVHD